MERKLKLYYTSDVHGYLFPGTYKDKEIHSTGLLNCAGNFKKDGNTLVLDGGDTLQGSPMAAYLSDHYGPEMIAEVYNDAGYDHITLGNHDFNFGYEYLEKYLSHLNAQCQCANVVDKTGKLNIIPSRIHTMENGLKVGIVGIVTDYITIWEQPAHLERFEVTDAYEAAARELERIRPEADIVIALYHGGYENDLDSGKLLSQTKENVGYRICRDLDYDLLLTAHQHMPVSGRELFGTHTLQVAPNGVEFAEVEICAGSNGIKIKSEICPAGDYHNPQSYQKLLPLEIKVQAWLDQEVGFFEKPVPFMSKLDMALYGSPIADFFNQVQIEATGADISCIGLGNPPMELNSRVTMRDIASIYPFSNTLVLLEVGEAELREALERCGEYYGLDEQGKVKISDVFLKPKIEHYNYDFFSGITYEFDIKRPVGNRLTSLLYQGQPIGNRKLSLCMSDYRATGTGGYPVYKTCTVLKQIQKEVPELAIEYLKKHRPVKIDDSCNFKVVW